MTDFFMVDFNLTFVETLIIDNSFLTILTTTKNYYLFQHEADSSDMLHEVAADFVCNALFTSEVSVCVHVCEWFLFYTAKK